MKTKEGKPIGGPMARGSPGIIPGWNGDGSGTKAGIGSGPGGNIGAGCWCAGCGLGAAKAEPLALQMVKSEIQQLMSCKEVLTYILEVTDYFLKRDGGHFTRLWSKIKRLTGVIFEKR